MQGPEMTEERLRPIAYAALVGSLTVEVAKSLKPGDVLLHKKRKNYDGTPERWRVNGKPQIWKRNPERVLIPIKRGLREFGYIRELDLHLYDLE